MSPSRLTFYAILLFWWVICVTIAILATHSSLKAPAPVHLLNKPRIPVLPAAHPGFPSPMVKRHKLSEGCVACHQYKIPNELTGRNWGETVLINYIGNSSSKIFEIACGRFLTTQHVELQCDGTEVLELATSHARLRGKCCTRKEVGSHYYYSRPPPPPSLQIPEDQGVTSNKAASTYTYRSSPKARVKGNPFLRRVPGLNYTQDKPFSTPDPILSVPQPLPSQFALSPHYLRNGNLTWLTVPPPPPLPSPNDAKWSAPPLLAMAQ